MEEKLALELVRNLKTDGKDSEEILITDSTTRIQYAVIVRRALGTDQQIHTRSTLNPAGAVCSRCGGSGRA